MTRAGSLSSHWIAVPTRGRDERAAAAGGAEARGAQPGLADEARGDEVDALDAGGRGGDAGRERDDLPSGQRDGDAVGRRDVPGPGPGCPGRRDRRGPGTAGSAGAGIGRRGRAVRIAVAAAARVDARAAHGGDARSATRNAPPLARIDFAPVSRSTWMTAPPPTPSATTRSPSGSMSIAPGSLERRAGGEHGLGARGRVDPHDLAVAGDVQRAVQLDGDVTRVGRAARLSRRS